jgi:hypothetical protein
MQDVAYSAVRAAAVAPSDSLFLGGNGASLSASWASGVTPPPFARRLYVGGSGGSPGNVTVVTLSGDLVTYSNVPNGSYLHVACTQVKATGTTSTSLVAEYW